MYTHNKIYDFIVFCFLEFTMMFLLSLCDYFTYIAQGCFASIGAFARLPQCPQRKPEVLHMCYTIDT